MLVRNLVSFEKFSILTKVGFEYQHSLSHHLLNLRKRFVVFKTDQTNGLSITIIISGTDFKMCLSMRHTVWLAPLPWISYENSSTPLKSGIYQLRYFNRAYHQQS